ncbi:MAG: hypothetical protein GY913_26400 [Proteobacteria bacterium]|nr:hypothetical protein [Pseudomonadota bacterium]MCP4920448.1 hypothetical protein [Pseudomonadota bacterium]
MHDPKARMRAHWETRAHFAAWGMVGGALFVVAGGLALVVLRALDIGVVLVAIGIFLAGKGAVTRQQADAYKRLREE